MNTMQAELPLFDEENTTKEVKIPEAKIITPLAQVLDHVTPKATREPPQKLENSSSFRQSLDELFPEQAYDDKDLKKAKEFLGEIANEFSPEQLNGAVIEVQYLAQSWLDDFERSIFKGLTLKEVLHEKGGL